MPNSNHGREPSIEFYSHQLSFHTAYRTEKQKLPVALPQDSVELKLLRTVRTR